MARPIVRRFLQAFVKLGPKGVIVIISQKIGRRLHIVKTPPLAYPSDSLNDATNLIHPFDVAHGTETGGVIWGENLPSGHPNDLWSTAYYGVSPSLFTQILTTLNLDWQRFTFIDFGCGKGRAIMLASRFPFSRIIGVELAPQLSTVATANVQRFSADWQQCHTIEVLNADATTFDYPPGPIVLYLYNPFFPAVLKRCLQNLTRSLSSEPRELYLIYAIPDFENLFKKHAPLLQKQWDRLFTMSNEDAQADRFGSSQERVVLYSYIPSTKS